MPKNLDTKLKSPSLFEPGLLEEVAKQIGPGETYEAVSAEYRALTDTLTLNLASYNLNPKTETRERLAELRRQENELFHFKCSVVYAPEFFTPEITKEATSLLKKAAKYLKEAGHPYDCYIQRRNPKRRSRAEEFKRYVNRHRVLHQQGIELDHMIEQYQETLRDRPAA